MKLLNRSINAALDLIFTRSFQERLGRHIFSHARGENNDEAESNGEYALLKRIANAGLEVEVVFDVGANKGEWTANVRRILGTHAHIYAFEPVRETHECLSKRLVSLPSGDRVHPMHIALGDSDGVATIHVSGHLAGSNSLFERRGTMVQGERVEQIALRRGDGFCAEMSISRISLLKIDTEGNEMAVLRGFHDMLATKSVDIIQFEYGGTWIDSRTLLGDAFSYLQGLGYRLGKIYPSRIDFLGMYDQRFENFAYANWIAVRPEIEVSLSST